VRRRLLPIATAGVLFLNDARPALAHGLGGRLDLPVPRWLFVYGAAVALVISFVALAVLWRSPRLEGRKERDGHDGPLQSLLSSTIVEWTLRAVGLALFDRGGIRRAGLNLVADGTPRVSLADKTGSPRLQANVGSNEVPDLSLIDTEGRRIAMFVLPDGKPAFGLIDAAARVRAAMDLGKDGAVRLMLADPRATERAELIVMPDGTPRLTLVGRTGRITYHGP